MTLTGQELNDLSNLISREDVVASVDMGGLTDIVSNIGIGNIQNTWKYDATEIPAAQNMVIIPGDGTVTIRWDVLDPDEVIDSVTVLTNSTNAATSFTSFSPNNVELIFVIVFRYYFLTLSP